MDDTILQRGRNEDDGVFIPLTLQHECGGISQIDESFDGALTLTVTDENDVVAGIRVRIAQARYIVESFVKYFGKAVLRSAPEPGQAFYEAYCTLCEEPMDDWFDLDETEKDQWKRRDGYYNRWK